MTINRILLAAALLIGQKLPAEAQWTVDRNTGNSRATALGVEGNVRLTVTCRAGNQALALVLPETPDFRAEVVEAQWDDGSSRSYRLPHENRPGSLESSQVMELIAKLRQHQWVRLRVTTASDELVADRIDLTGSSRAIRSLPCGLSDAEIRSILVRQSVARYSGSCACPYNTDRAGRRCGRRSAYSRPGGASPLCYSQDVSAAAVEAYRRRSGGRR